jgi:nanoRNase/pAp phosphatase (c-di-AMP/oligoRNAs hydrolase)
VNEAIVRFIRDARRVMVITHVSPDGDAIGSLLGLGWALRWLGKEYTLACADPVPRRFTYLPGSEAIVTGPEPERLDRKRSGARRSLCRGRRIRPGHQPRLR